MWRNGRGFRQWLMREIWGPDAPIVARKTAKKELGRGPARNWRYRQWCRSLPCAVCGFEPAGEAAHTGERGLSQIASDWSCIPLCSDCHTMSSHAYHRIGRREFERRHNLDIQALVKRLNCCWWNQWKAAND